MRVRALRAGQLIFHVRKSKALLKLKAALMPDVGPDKLRDFIVKEQAKMKSVIERSGASAD